LAACSSSGKPSESQIEQAVVKARKGEIIKNFKKTDGFEKDPKTYVADVEFDKIEMKQPMIPAHANDAREPIAVTSHVKAKITFIKEESGWAYAAIDITSIVHKSAQGPSTSPPQEDPNHVVMKISEMIRSAHFNKNINKLLS
jgi:hypothetical protein